MEEQRIRPLFRPWIKYNSILGVSLILILGIPRFILVLGANITRSYALVSVVFMAMWFIPFILLNKEGRRSIGIKTTTNCLWLLYSVAVGILLSLVVYLLFFLAFGNIIQNSYVYISGVSAFTGIELTPDIRLTYFLIYAASGMTFSPIGEEFMYRGVIHGCFVPRFGENKASVIDSLAFAFTHLAHFGIVYVSGVWQFLPIPACMWIVSMFVVSRCFFVCKKRSGSLLGAILSHAAFNITNVLLCRK